MKHGSEALPFVSVIVPVRNGGTRAVLCVEALVAQNYPNDRYEVLIVDNGSTDGTQQRMRSYPVTFLEDASTASPYVARNCGMRHAKGDVYAFTDATCVASRNWLAEGVKALNNGADLVGGQISFELPPAPTAAEIYDSLVHARVADMIRGSGSAPGGNLFFRKSVCDTIGPWPERRSGGDICYTARATREGFTLVYAQQAEVLYPARSFWPLIRKAFRTGAGHPYLWELRGLALVGRLLRLSVSALKPLTKTRVRELCQRQKCAIDEHKIGAVICVGWFNRLAVNLGRLYSGFCILLKLRRAA
ncbi:MAG: glycosyltransferase [bacterium]